MHQGATISGSAHPAPHREKAPLSALAFGLLSAPIAWALHLLINYSIAGQRCIGAVAREDILRGPPGTLAMILLVDIASLALAVSAGYVAFVFWKKTKDEKVGEARALVHAGEGRTRFMAMCGVLTSTLFGFAIAVDALGSIVGPPC